MKCDKCGFISFDYNHNCPICTKDLGVARSRLGIHNEPPEINFDEYFTGGSGAYQASARPAAPEAELDLDAGTDDFEFTLDD